MYVWKGKVKKEKKITKAIFCFVFSHFWLLLLRYICVHFIYISCQHQTYSFSLTLQYASLFGPSYMSQKIDIIISDDRHKLYYYFRINSSSTVGGLNAQQNAVINSYGNESQFDFLLFTHLCIELCAKWNVREIAKWNVVIEIGR